MKKVFAAIAAIALAATVCAARPTGFNIGAGYSADFYKYSGILSDNNATFGGAFVEAGYDFSFSDILGLYAGARFNIGFNFDGIGDDNFSIFNISERSNFTIPVMFAANIPVGRSSLFINVGPSFDFWLTNKGIVGGETESSISTKTINYFDGDDTFNRVNVLMGGKVGVNIINHIKVYAAYDHTLINTIKSDTVKGGKSQFRIGAAYVF